MIKETYPLKEKVGDSILTVMMLIIILKLSVIGIRPNYIAISGTSMEPTIKEGDLMKVQYISLSKVSRGDMLVLEPDNNVPIGNEKLLKRCIGLPGDEIKVVEAINGQEFIIRNGELLWEDYTSNYYENVLKSVETLGGEIKIEIVVPENSVYVLGDNRKSLIFPSGESARLSYDSRDFGPMKVNPKRVMKVTKMEDRSKLPLTERILFIYRNLADRITGKQELYPYPKPKEKED